MYIRCIPTGLEPSMTNAVVQRAGQFPAVTLLLPGA